MIVPWLRIINAALGLGEVQRRKAERSGVVDDARRLEIEAERQRAERALKIELLRQAGDREIGRLRLVAGLSIVSWLGALIVSVSLTGTGVADRVMVGAGWISLIAAVITALVAQMRVSDALKKIGDEQMKFEDLSSGLPGMLSPWLIVLGLSLVGPRHAPVVQLFRLR